MKKMIKERQYCDYVSAGGAGSLCEIKQPTVVIGPEKQTWVRRLKRTLRQQAGESQKNLQHKTIENLSENRLRDIGLTREELANEQSHAGWPDLPRGIR